MKIRHQLNEANEDRNAGGDAKGQSLSFGTNDQKTGKALMSRRAWKPYVSGLLLSGGK